MDENTISAIRKELKEHVDEATKNSAQSFFKEEVKFLGIKTSIVRKIAKKYFEEIKYKSKKEIFSLCEQLLQSDYGEEAVIAFENLKAWTRSNNRWLRRGSAVTLILPARKGKFLNDVFEIADNL